MARRLANSVLQASTVDIINTIRQNASYEYQSQVPEISHASEIPKVGEVLYGYPALANQFLNALINRIALVRVNAATFNNAYKELKKGYLEYGETVEEVFVAICKAREFSAEKAADRELKRTLPDVRSAFHSINWRVQYPVTIEDEQLSQAFLSEEGVQDLIARIVDAVYTSAEYDEYLLFKYLMIKAITHGQMAPVAIDTTDFNNTAIEFRAASNDLTFMNTKFNAAAVHTTTPKEDQYIFMDSHFNAQYDVDILSAAFNMDKADFMGRLMLIDDWTTFDNERFAEITANSDMIDQITEEELTIMGNVVGVLVDKEWFQVYDNKNKFTEDYVAAGMYWNYFYNVWKTVSSSPFSNAIVFVNSTASIALPDTITVEVTDKSESAEATVISLYVDEDNADISPRNYNFVQTEAATEAGIGIHKYGAIMFPTGETTVGLEMIINGQTYVSCTRSGSTGSYTYAAANLTTSNKVGDEIMMCKQGLIS